MRNIFAEPMLTHLHFFLNFFVNSGNSEKNGWPDFFQGGEQGTLESIFVGEVNSGA